VQAQQWPDPIQTETIMSYWSQNSVINATAYISPNGEATYYLEDENKMYVTLGSTCEYHCANPTPQIDLADTLESYDYTHSATFVQNTTWNGVPVMEFTWNENLGPIPMNTLYLYVSIATGAPVQMNRYLEPFGSPLGWENITFQQFNVTVPSPSIFVVPGAKDCPAGQNGECQDAIERFARMQRRTALPTF
jgi:hypothetical protein